MGQEIERKFLVDKEKWQEIEKPQGEYYRQGYFSTDPHKTIRVRSTPQVGYLTIKGPSKGAVRLEYEYEIPKIDADELLDRFPLSVLSKIRYKVSYKGKIWEVDEYLEKNKGLVTAEIELEEATEKFHAPDWLKLEVTGQKEYYNANLTLHPYAEWRDD